MNKEDTLNVPCGTNESQFHSRESQYNQTNENADDSHIRIEILENHVPENIVIDDGKMPYIFYGLFLIKLYPLEAVNLVFIKDIIFSLIGIYFSIVITIDYKVSENKWDPETIKSSLIIIICSLILLINSLVLKMRFLSWVNDEIIEPKIKVWLGIRSFLYCFINIYWAVCVFSKAIIHTVDLYNDTSKLISKNGHEISIEGRILYQSGYEGTYLQELSVKLLYLFLAIVYQFIFIYHLYLGKIVFEATFKMIEGQRTYLNNAKQLAE